jgi:hypothetical protein
MCAVDWSNQIMIFQLNLKYLAWMIKIFGFFFSFSMNNKNTKNTIGSKKG